MFVCDNEKCVNTNDVSRLYIKDNRNNLYTVTFVMISDGKSIQVELCEEWILEFMSGGVD